MIDRMMQSFYQHIPRRQGEMDALRHARRERLAKELMANPAWVLDALSAMTVEALGSTWNSDAAQEIHRKLFAAANVAAEQMSQPPTTENGHE